jgi:hypothetical protein
MKRIVPILLALCLMSGCTAATTLTRSPAALAISDTLCDLGAIPPADREAAVREAVLALPPGRQSATVTIGPPFTGREEAVITDMLRNAGIRPDRTARVRTQEARRLTITFHTLHPVQTESRPLPGEPHWYSSMAVSTAFGASSRGNLAAHIVDPREIEKPAALDPPNSIAATGAVENYQTGQVRGLPEQSLEAGKAGQ